MADVVTRLKVESSEYDSKIQRAAKGIQHLEDATRRAGKTMADASKDDITFVKSLGQMETVSTSAKGKVAELSQAFVNLTVQYNNLTKAEKSSQFGKAMSQSLDQLKGRIKGLNADIAGAQKQLGGLGGGLGSGLGGGGGLDLGGMVKGLGPAAIAAGAAGLAVDGLKKAFGDYLTVHREFEQANANLAAVLGKTRGDIVTLTEDAKKYGATTMFTASEVTELQTNLAKLGFSMSDIKASTKAVLDLSAATGMDLAQSASIAGAALRSFGLNAGEMDRVTSVLGVSTSKSALDMEKLSVAMPIVGSAANAMGFSIEDTVALLGKLVDTGMDASTAATALRNIFLKLADPSSKMSQTIGGNIRSLDDLVPALQKCKDEGMDLGEMFEIAKERGTVAFNTLVNGADDVTKLRDELTDCGSAMQQMVDTQMDTLEGATKQLDSAWEGLLLSFQSSNGIIAATKRALADLLTAWTNWNKREQGGMTGASTYEKGVSDEAKKNINAQIAEQRKKGVSDDALIKGSEKKKAALEAERTKLLEVEKVWQEYQAAQQQVANAGQAGAKAIKLAMKKAEAAEKKLVAAGGNKNMTRESIQKSIADKSDRIAQHDYIISAIQSTAPQPKTVDPNKIKGGGGDKNKKKDKEELSELEKRDKRIKEITKSIEEMNGILASNADENTKAWATDKLETFQKELDKLNGKKQVQQIEGPSGYSQEGIAALRKQLQDGMKDMQMGSDEYMFEAERLVDLTTFENILKTAVENGIHLDQSTLETMFEGIDNAEFSVTPSITDDAWKALVDQINEKLKEKDLPAIELDVKTGGVKELDKEVKKTTDNVAGAAAAFSALGDAMSQIDDPGAKVAGMIAEAIASVASGYGAATAQAATLGPWAWIAFAVTGLATMISTIAGIKQATAGAYAQGGIIPGNSFSGDNLTANVNSGELILNRAQQGAIAGQLNSNPMGNMKLSTQISGRNLRVVLNNDNRSEGGSRGYYSNIH